MQPFYQSGMNQNHNPNQQIISYPNAYYQQHQSQQQQQQQQQQQLQNQQQLPANSMLPQNHVTHVPMSYHSQMLPNIPHIPHQHMTIMYPPIQNHHLHPNIIQNPHNLNNPSPNPNLQSNSQPHSNPQPQPQSQLSLVQDNARVQSELSNIKIEKNFKKSSLAKSKLKVPHKKISAFVSKLYTMLHDPNLSHLIWWSRLHQNDEITFALLPGSEFAHSLTTYFKHGNVASFVRQLHMYGFHKVCDSNPPPLFQNAFGHPHPVWEFRHSTGRFRRGDQSALHLIKRRSNSSRRSSGNGQKPDENDKMSHDKKLAKSSISSIKNEDPTDSNDTYQSIYYQQQDSSKSSTPQPQTILQTNNETRLDSANFNKVKVENNDNQNENENQVETENKNQNDNPNEGEDEDDNENENEKGDQKQNANAVAIANERRSQFDQKQEEQEPQQRIPSISNSGRALLPPPSHSYSHQHSPALTSAPQQGRIYRPFSPQRTTSPTYFRQKSFQEYEIPKPPSAISESTNVFFQSTSRARYPSVFLDPCAPAPTSSGLQLPPRRLTQSPPLPLPSFYNDQHHQQPFIQQFHPHGQIQQPTHHSFTPMPRSIPNEYTQPPPHPPATSGSISISPQQQRNSQFTIPPSRSSTVTPQNNNSLGQLRPSIFELSHNHSVTSSLSTQDSIFSNSTASISSGASIASIGTRFGSLSSRNSSSISSLLNDDKKISSSTSHKFSSSLNSVSTFIEKHDDSDNKHEDNKLPPINSNEGRKGAIQQKIEEL